MMPLFFGRRDRRLFGIYSPATGRRLMRGVVICNPWGVEAMRAHRSLRLLADSLCRSGFDVLRFDYFGTGDSYGDYTSETLEGWQDDTVLAVEELVGLASIRSTSLVGLRLGGYAAAGSAARIGRSVDKVVLWDPVLNGTEFWSGLAKRRQQDACEVAPLEIGGFPMSKEFQLQLRKIQLPEVMQSVAVPTLLALSSQEMRADPAIDNVTVQVIEGPACWLEEADYGAGAVPVDLVQAVTSWLK